MKNIKTIFVLLMVASIISFSISTNVEAQKTQDRLSPTMPDRSTPGKTVSGGPGTGNEGGKVGQKGDRLGSPSSGKGDRLESPSSGKGDRLISPTRPDRPDNVVRTATGYGYGPPSSTPKTQDRLPADKTLTGRDTYRTVAPPVRTVTSYGYGPPSAIPKNQDRLTPNRTYGGNTVVRTVTPSNSRQSNFPAPRPDLVGTPYYWNGRLMGFIRNNPGVSDPSYNKLARYYDIYVNRVARTLSPLGQSFIARTGPAMQRIVEEAIRRDPVGFAQRERNPEAFGRFMANVHTRAYYESGWAGLPSSDQWKIGRAIDIKDLIGRDGRITARDLIPGIFGQNPMQPARRVPVQPSTCTCSYRRY